MTEILTESFCERCGTRYTFESARPRARLKGVRVLSRGLKNFVLSDETSMDEAMAAARSDTDREQTSHQLDAFHKTFNFCMSCRQYTCPNCWNEVEARCLSCAPNLGREIMPAPFPDLPSGPFDLGPDAAVNGTNGLNGTNGATHPIELIGVAEIEATRRDEDIDAAARLAALTSAAAARTDAAGATDPEVAAPGGEAAQPLEPAAPAPGPATGASEPIEPDPTDAAHAAALVTDVRAPTDAGLDQPGAATDDGPDAGTAARLAAFGVGAASLRAAPPDENAPDPFEDTGAAPTPSFLRAFRAGEAPDPETVAGVAAASDAVTPVEAPEPAAALAPPTEPAAEATEPPLPPIPYLTPVEGDAPEPVAASPEPAPAGDAVDTAPDPAAPEPGETVAPELVAAATLAAAAAGSDATKPEVEGPAEVAPEPVAEPVAAVPEPVAEPVAAESEPPATTAEPASEPEAPAPVGGDVVSQPVWQRVAPDPGDAPPAAPGLAAAASAAPPGEPQWPASPQWPSSSPAAGLPFLGRPAAPQGGLEALWAESSREVATPTSQSRPAGVIQPCVSCGLSLSATARFCRRCGTPQAG